MHWFASLLCLFILGLGMINANEQPVEKLIVSSNQDESIAQEDLLKLKVYLLENTATRMFQEKYKLDVKMEHFSNYNAVVISPIHSLTVRNELLVLLSPVFSDIFYINEKKIPVDIKKPTVPAQSANHSMPITHIEKENKDSWVNEIGLQWLAIWILAVVGLFLSVRSRRKMAHLNKNQKEMNVNQTKIEKEIKALGDKDA